MLKGLFRLIMAPVILLMMAGGLAVGVALLDDATPWVQWTAQQIPALQGPVVGLQKMGGLLLENGGALWHDTRQTFFPDPQTRARQIKASQQLEVVERELQSKQQQLERLQSQIELLEHQQAEWDDTAHPLKKWMTGESHTQKSIGPEQSKF